MACSSIVQAVRQRGKRIGRRSVQDGLQAEGQGLGEESTPHSFDMKHAS